MSKKYNRAMDEITVSDELKAKITAAAAQKINEKNSKSRYSGMFYLRCAAGCAACMVLCLAAAFAVWKANVRLTEKPPVYVAHNAEKPPVQTEPGKNSISDNTKENNTDKTQNEQGTAYTNPGKIQDNNSAENAPAIGGESNSKTDDNAPVLNENEDFETSGGGMVASGSDVEDLEDIAALRTAAGYDFKVPSYIPDGYEFDSASLMFGNLVQIVYVKNDNRLIYRTERTDDDISGLYNEYEVETADVSGISVTLKSDGGKCCAAVWVDEESYAVISDEGIDKEEMIKITESVVRNKNS